MKAAGNAAGKTTEKATEKTEQRAQLTRLLRAVREELDREFDRRARDGSGPWSQALPEKIWARIDEKRRRAQASPIARAARTMMAVALAVWSWRPVRLLLP